MSSFPFLVTIWAHHKRLPFGSPILAATVLLTLAHEQPFFVIFVFCSRHVAPAVPSAMSLSVGLGCELYARFAALGTPALPLSAWGWELEPFNSRLAFDVGRGFAVCVVGPTAGPTVLLSVAPTVVPAVDLTVAPTRLTTAGVDIPVLLRGAGVGTPPLSSLSSCGSPCRSLSELVLS